MAPLTGDFVGIGSTGRARDAEGVATTLASQRGYVQPDPTDFLAVSPAPDLQLLTYRDDSAAHGSV